MSLFPDFQGLEAFSQRLLSTSAVLVAAVVVAVVADLPYLAVADLVVVDPASVDLAAVADPDYLVYPYYPDSVAAVAAA